MRVILVFLALVLLASDVAQDASFFSVPANRTAGLLFSAAVRNLLLLAAALALLLQSRAAAWLVLVCAVIGLVRRATFIAPLTWDHSTWQIFHSGADMLFRLVLLGAVYDMLKRLREQR